jgi:carboxypeptidase family protein
MATRVPRHTILLALLIAGAAVSADARAAELRPAGVAGRVVSGNPGGSSRNGGGVPLPAAGVYAYQLADLTLKKVTTDAQGRFLFADLPAGVYQIIVHKPGFLAAVLPLERATAAAYQFVELQLAPDVRGAGRSGDDFWSVRNSVPGDVLREIERGESAVQVASLFAPTAADALLRAPSAAQFKTDILAMTGVDQIAAGAGQLAGGRVGIEGRLGQTQVGLRGRFWQLQAPGGSFDPGEATGGVGQARSVMLDLARGAGSRVQINSLNNHLDTRAGGGELPVDFEQHGVRWSQAVGENGRSEFAAQYTSESNYHRQAAYDPADIPEASRTWKVEGSYTTSFGPRSTLQTGVRYRERQIDLGSPGAARAFAGQPGQSNLDLFGRGGLRLEPSVLVEYGLYSTLSDGSLAVTPQGGLVLQLGDDWQLGGSVSRRLYQDAGRAELDFLPTLYGDSDLCEEGSESCYEVRLSRKLGEDESLTLGAVRRTVGKTLRLYFSEDFFDRLESLYLVPGDELPEMRLEITRHLSPNVLATFESHLASGGGGTFHAGDGRSYENQVEYMVTSVDTHFQRTATGVFVALHRLDQQLQPLGQPAAPLMKAANENQVERLQLMLTQDLNILLDLAADWAVQLNMELSRGGEAAATAARNDDDVRRRFLGGISVRF